MTTFSQLALVYFGLTPPGPPPYPLVFTLTGAYTPPAPTTVQIILSGSYYPPDPS